MPGDCSFFVQAEYFHRFGTTLMKLTSQKIEEAYKEKMLETMAAQEHGERGRLERVLAF